MLDYALMDAMARVVRTGSFDKAAREIGVTPSAISQRVKLLEERLGTSLIVRGQPCTATAAGKRLCRHVEEIGLMELSLRADLGPVIPAGRAPTIRIAVNADSLATWFVPALAGIEERLFDLVIDDESNTAEWLRRGEVSAAVSTAPGPVRGCGSRSLGAQTYIATASPAFMRRWFAGGVGEDALRAAPSITFNTSDELQDRWLAETFGQSLPRPSHWIPSSHGFVDAALAGIGWGMNPASLVEPHLAAGRLVALVPGRPLLVPLFWHWSRAVEGALKDITASIVRTARTRLAAPPSPGGGGSA
ncbi:LysR family transcriptional regulator ArgP [Labrys monachus]|uniref:LysR family transcriptional regulator (Chromosome initiation inhibitor) n=1 Tax=Labrys monachus TaxID=217067 RepID=A0ABU0F7K8_9HYPH|nr:LysR family transcriptional regulator ArgP [Labrys monachus]MDQ0390595.1 LysR family transcriptional regulator (chromosome initiation inhibitor) [Labrys monachus]